MNQKNDLFQMSDLFQMCDLFQMFRKTYWNQKIVMYQWIDLYHSLPQSALLLSLQSSQDQWVWSRGR